MRPSERGVAQQLELSHATLRDHNLTTLKLRAQSGKTSVGPTGPCRQVKGNTGPLMISLDLRRGARLSKSWTPTV